MTAVGCICCGVDVQPCRVVTTGPVQHKQCVKWGKLLTCSNKCSLQGSLEVQNDFCLKGNVLILVKPVAKLPFSQMSVLMIAREKNFRHQFSAGATSSFLLLCLTSSGTDTFFLHLTCPYSLQLDREKRLEVLCKVQPVLGWWCWALRTQDVLISGWVFLAHLFHPARAQLHNWNVALGGTQWGTP